MRILAIDPGTTESGWVIIDTDTYKPEHFAKSSNDSLLLMIQANLFHWDEAVIEMVQSYGMPVGAEVFETCVWTGRYIQALANNGTPQHRVFRKDIKLHHCGTTKAKDTNITQALVDRFAPGQPNHGKGTKANPGFFYGFAKDVWASYALGVYAADQQRKHHTDLARASHCIGDDPHCPCQDGDPCHYRGTNPMPTPTPPESPTIG